MKWLVAMPLVLAACASAPKGKPQDATLARLGHAGDIAFNLEESCQAAEQYRAALNRAYTRDDAGAIGDAGFNLATAELRADQPREAMRTASDLRADLARRGLADPDFDLISATALFRLHDLPAADRIAARLTAAADPALVNAAWFLRGLIAAERGDKDGLAKAAASLTPAADRADVAELRSRLTGDPALAMQSADLRRDELDYRGMARALAVAAQFTRDASHAADLYLRAGRSAAAQGDAADARAWLGKAHDLATDPALRDEAVKALRGITSASSCNEKPAPSGSPRQAKSSGRPR